MNGLIFLLFGMFITILGIISIFNQKALAKSLRYQYFNLFNERVSEWLALIMTPIVIILGLFIIFLSIGLMV